MSAAIQADISCAGAAPQRPPTAAALGAQLEMLRGVIAPLAGPLYRAAPSRRSGTIGAHVRHSLDHVRALVGCLRSGELSYDARLRDTPIEREPDAAVAEIDRLWLALGDIGPADLERPVRLRVQLDRTGREVIVRSSIGRELAYTIQHTIHHAALVAVLLDQLGTPVAPAFGYAPSTELTLTGDKGKGRRAKGKGCDAPRAAASIRAQGFGIGIGNRDRDEG